MCDRQPCDTHKNEQNIKTDFLQLTVTADNQAEAVDLIKLLTEKRIVACAQVQGPESTLEVEDIKWRCRFKTSNGLFDEVRVEIDRFFKGKTQKIQSSPIVKGSEQFLKWLQAELSN